MDGLRIATMAAMAVSIFRMVFITNPPAEFVSSANALPEARRTS